MSNLDLLNIVSKYSKDENYNFTGYLMYKNKEVAEIKDTNFIRSLDDNLLPIIMINKNPGSFESWLQTRVIDTHRINSRQIRRRLSVRTEVPKEIVIKARAVSITDNYWIRWINENITYSEVRNRLSDGLNTVALYGNVIESNFANEDITPELTNIGSFEKCWKLIDGKWYMIKKGSYKENFAEVLVSNIALALGFKAVQYEAIDEGSLVRCKDFTTILEEYNYHIPNIDFDKIESIISLTLVDFPVLNKDAKFKEVVFNIIKNNHEELLNIQNKDRNTNK